MTGRVSVYTDISHCTYVRLNIINAKEWSLEIVFWLNVVISGLECKFRYRVESNHFLSKEVAFVQSAWSENV